ncbi:MAG: DNA sulfur modification protein DndB [Nitrosopumilus sp.]|uniref:DNA sulfur modification protein DndB n=1 Tax=Nitrosopumilus sp. TaxID=2024843 RepID=UPI00242F8C25|nr:DNA sulfur modification protein DndB [Nitrosopumilus sp.]MCV0366395.1 DNA sulfur modification protein DndB [Nitrosopumilus sp.]
MSKTLADELETGTEVYGFDAIRGVQASRPFYVAMCPLKIIPKLFLFNDHELPPMLRAQRTLRVSRIPAIANYIVNNPKDYIFSSLTASVDGKLRFSPAPSLGENGKLGRLYISMNSKMLINDGQHRRAAIEEALKQQPGLGNESISVVFFEDKGLKRSQQMFADLNKHATKPSKSLGILYDHRDSFSQFIVKLVNSVEIFKDRTELEKTSISNRASEFFTLNGVSEATRQLLNIKSKNIPEEKQQLAHEFWDEVSKNIPEWKNLVDEQITAGELRHNYVHAHTNFLNALGMVGHILITHYPNWKQILKKLQKIDWSKNSSLWEGKIVLDGKMIKQKAGIRKAADVILHECGITKTLDDFGDN